MADRGPDTEARQPGSADTGAREPWATARAVLEHFNLEEASVPIAHQSHVELARAVLRLEQVLVGVVADLSHPIPQVESALALAAGVGVPPDAALSKRLREAAERWMPGTDFGPDLLRQAADALAGVGEARPAEPPQDSETSGSARAGRAQDGFCPADPWCGCGAGEECKRDKALREGCDDESCDGGLQGDARALASGPEGDGGRVYHGAGARVVGPAGGGEVRRGTSDQALASGASAPVGRSPDPCESCGRLREQLDAAREALLNFDHDRARAALGVVGPPTDTGSGASAAPDGRTEA